MEDSQRRQTQKQSIRECMVVFLSFIRTVISEERREKYERWVLWWRTKSSRLNCSNRRHCRDWLKNKTKQTKPTDTESTLTGASDFCSLLSFDKLYLGTSLPSLRVLQKTSEKEISITLCYILSHWSLDFPEAFKNFF